MYPFHWRSTKQLTLENSGNEYSTIALVDSVQYVTAIVVMYAGSRDAWPSLDPVLSRPVHACAPDAPARRRSDPPATTFRRATSPNPKYFPDDPTPHVPSPLPSPPLRPQGQWPDQRYHLHQEHATAGARCPWMPPSSTTSSRGQRGGRDVDANLVLLCRECHGGRHG